eukprot:Nitzschia sp. Nitz4//scaffold67_size101165//92837//94018//NITZ4_004545-RA/size101165-processed-gene-0.67-mRNA-1//-1//CDS//3329556522//1591//frame0
MTSFEEYPNDDYDEDELEFQGLLKQSSAVGSQRGSSMGQPPKDTAVKDIRSSSYRCRSRLFLGLVILLAVSIAIHWEYVVVLPAGSSASKKNTLDSFQCPANLSLSTENFYEEDAEEDYLSGQPEFDEEFLSTYRTHVFDGWSRNFEEFKESMAEWKVKHFVPYLQSGNTIYESACGLGLNLYLTLELLQEHGNITNITVYGNEYIGENAEQANKMLDTLMEAQTAAVPRNKIGAICQGDSTDLRFVPSDSFDLVFTGYLSPLWDPLNLLEGTDEGSGKMQKLCRDAQNKDSSQQWEAQKLVDIMQERQEAWYDKWFQEMIRIAKPGAPVIVEDIARPKCEALRDWGGLHRSYWRSGIERYGWDVNRSTVAFGKRSEDFDNNRYHMFVLKNKR